jgi:hypothetical protein
VPGKYRLVVDWGGLGGLAAIEDAWGHEFQGGRNLVIIL